MKSIEEQLIDLGRKHKNLVVLVDDSVGGIADSQFGQIYRNQCFQFGKGVQNMFAAAAGFAAVGKLPLVIGDVSAAYKQILTCIATPNLNVKIMGSEDDIFIGRLPNMKVAEDLESMFEGYGPEYLKV